MSTASTPSQQQNDLGFEDALLIGGAIIGVMVALVASRFGLYFVLDMCCDLDGGRRRRSVAEFLRKLFPFWHVRTQPLEQTRPNHNASASTRSSSNRTIWTAETIAERLAGGHIIGTREELNTMIKEESISSNSVNSARDVESSSQSDQQSVVSEAVFPCSICLNEIKVGDKVYRASACGHVFHFECLSQWILSNGNKRVIECPNCRTTMIQSES